MTKYPFFTGVFLILLLGIPACRPSNPNVDDSGKDQLKSLELEQSVNREELAYRDVVYVPIYSDIYLDEKNPKVLLTATLSIRNTSYEDSLFISKIDYFNTEGALVRSYIDRQISLPPMATVNYVVEKEDDTGGPGANFTVVLSARNAEVRPLIQAVMIGESGNKAFSFSTNGHSLEW